MFNNLYKIIIGIIGIGLLFLFISMFYERVEPGYEGIKENLMGKNKGVQEEAIGTGIIWHNP